MEIMAKRRSRIKLEKVTTKERRTKAAKGMLKRMKKMDGEEGGGMGRKKRTTEIKSEEEKNLEGVRHPAIKGKTVLTACQMLSRPSRTTRRLPTT